MARIWLLGLVLAYFSSWPPGAAAQQAITQADEARLLAPGEMIATTSGGCRIILPSTPANADYLKRVGPVDWSGPCRSGFAHGKGWLGAESEVAKLAKMSAAPVVEFRFGRQAPIRQDKDGVSYYSATGRNLVMLSRIDETFKPRWPDALMPDGSSLIADSSDRADRSLHLMAATASCSEKSFPDVTPEDRKAFAKCTDSNRVYFVRASILSDNGPEEDVRRVYCPDPTTPDGCEAIWRRLLAPVEQGAVRTITGAKAADVALRSELGPTFEAWEKSH